MEVLPAGQTEYTFTDISTGFFPDAEREFGDGMRTFALWRSTSKRDPADQGFALHGYDLVIAANVLHATRDLGETLAHCRSLLAPSGLLVAVEETARKEWLDLTFGLLPGWWRFQDAYRSDYALVGPPVWRRALTDAGFGRTSLVNDPSGSLLVLARGAVGGGGGRRAVRAGRRKRAGCRSGGRAGAPGERGRSRGPQRAIVRHGAGSSSH